MGIPPSPHGVISFCGQGSPLPDWFIKSAWLFVVVVAWLFVVVVKLHCCEYINSAFVGHR